MNKSQQRKLGALGVLSKQPSNTELNQIKENFLNQSGEFKHGNFRNKGKQENIPLETIHKFNHKKFALVGTSPTDGKRISRIISLNSCN